MLKKKFLKQKTHNFKVQVSLTRKWFANFHLHKNHLWYLFQMKILSLTNRICYTKSEIGV